MVLVADYVIVLLRYPPANNIKKSVRLANTWYVRRSAFLVRKRAIVGIESIGEYPQVQLFADPEIGKSQRSSTGPRAKGEHCTVGADAANAVYVDADSKPGLQMLFTRTRHVWNWRRWDDLGVRCAWH